jgi:hypothetical protein
MHANNPASLTSLCLLFDGAVLPRRGLHLWPLDADSAFCGLKNARFICVLDCDISTKLTRQDNRLVLSAVVRKYMVRL